MLYTRGRADMAAYTAAMPAASAPGQRFLYSSGDSNLLAAACVACSMPASTRLSLAGAVHPAGHRQRGVGAR
jgi:CubicO group peptidase (beta-lactamase class C family)